MNCQDVMLTHVYTCREQDTVERCAMLMRGWNIGFIPVVDEHERVVGVVTDRDLVMRVLAARRPGTTKVSEAMTIEPLAICRPGDDIKIAERRMASARKSRIIVVDEQGRLAGVISLSDIAHADGEQAAGHLLAAVTTREMVHIARPHA
jgi:CBS domain-containing protein